MSDGSPFDPTDSVHVAERLSVVATERDRLAARLAEVEAEAYYWRSLASENDAVDQLAAERDRLAQELEDARVRLQAVLDAWNPMGENHEMGPFFEAREFLARFPVREDGES